MMNIKVLGYFLLIIITVLSWSCSNSPAGSDENNADSAGTLPKEVLKTTKQYFTNPDGTVTELDLSAEIAYNEKEISVYFPDSTGKSFKITVTSMEKKVEGIYFTVKDRKYKEVFISSGTKPQITFTSDRGFGNMSLI